MQLFCYLMVNKQDLIMPFNKLSGIIYSQIELYFDAVIWKMYSFLTNEIFLEKWKPGLANHFGIFQLLG